MDLYIAILGLTLPSMMRFVSGGEMCNYPPDSAITNLTAERFLAGTELTYNCDPDHFAGITNYLTYTCDNSNGNNRWISEFCYCRRSDSTTTNTEIGNDSSHCEVSNTMNETIPTGDYCGPPPTVKNAKLDLSESTFPVGQEFNYIFECDGHAENTSHGVLQCQDASAWIQLSDGCINKTFKSAPWPYNIGINCTERNDNRSVKSDGSHEAEVTPCAGVYTICVNVAVGAITAIMVIFAIFKIAQWRIKSTGKGKFLQRTTVSTEKEEEMNAVHVPLNG
ncbi:uncharacterized protein LOC122925382 [Bufo gargarizans]|uniref:uncharacterized protein LOC122925382 n=1 Tax=Bufo gargarizans TaxID=30331 RepID=UPI001CF24BF0|nr:uncharacterized protein LOC122925382 [Bufo gargarizans]